MYMTPPVIFVLLVIPAHGATAKKIRAASQNSLGQLRRKDFPLGHHNSIGRELGSSCSPGDRGTSTGGGGCCFDAGCHDTAADAGCPDGYTGVIHVPWDACSWLNKDWNWYCCTGPVFEACASGKNEHEVAGCGRRARGNTEAKCRSDCASELNRLALTEKYKRGRLMLRVTARNVHESPAPLSD